MKRMLSLLLVLCLLAPCALAEHRVYYEIFPASFYDASGDGKGDLAGITAQVPYLDDLGVQGVWLMPIHPSPSYHKYDVLDYYAVDPDYGTIEDLKALSDRLHAKDMKLLLDLVINHTSSQHPWFLEAIQSLADGTESPYTDWYHFSQEAHPGWHTVPGADGWYYQGHFTYEMPDLNLDNEALREEILSICAHWIAQGVDGFRLDAILHYYGEDIPQNTAFLAWLMDSLRVMQPDIFVVGEAWKDGATIARYYGSGISSLFNFPFSGADGAIVQAIRNRKGAAFAQKIADWQQTWSAHPDASDAPFLSNHDGARIAGTLMRKPENLKLAASMLLTLPGSPFLYYGEEIGMTGSGRDENKRLPMLWHDTDMTGQCLPPADADQKAASLGSVQAMLADDTSLLSHYRTLIALRKAYPALQSGVVEPIPGDDPSLCAYRMQQDTEVLLVVHNTGRAEAPFAYHDQRYLLPAQESLIVLIEATGHTVLYPAQ